ncbi:MAG TPA: monofunctional biosynthetic peptidoglycan transglycosylase [Candidatus Manganitrophaceae bacterium]|nr:monofunctional biosynthetic peptidoglycan transglycosylase [Candidatus Manganitrophaceae bacterium]
MKRFKKIVLLLTLLVPCGLALYLLLLIPGVEALAKRNPQTTAFIEARRKEALERKKNRDVRQRWRFLSGISPHLQHAVIVSEDDRFYEHDGFDWEAIKDAVERDWEEKSFERGGSTISQQLAKNLYLTRRKTLLRKAHEAVITWIMEKKLTKQRILELYLNVAEWGEGIYGAEAAAEYYFDKSAADLTPREAAFLAAILPAPRYYQNHRETRYIEKRIDLIGRRMRKRYPETPLPPEVSPSVIEEAPSTAEPVENLPSAAPTTLPPPEPAQSEPK